MKRPKNIKGKIVRAAIYSRTLTRVKHYRGFGVHSPFVYGVIRNAIMKHDPQGDDRALYDELRKRGFSKRRAAQLQNLYTFRSFTSVVFAEESGELPKQDFGTLCIVMPSCPDEETLQLVGKATEAECTLCIISPHASRRRNKLLKKLLDSHRYTSIDNRGFLLLFFNSRLPKQHFNL